MNFKLTAAHRNDILTESKHERVIMLEGQGAAVNVSREKKERETRSPKVNTALLRELGLT